jgi:hypothetical protein
MRRITYTTLGRNLGCCGHNHTTPDTACKCIQKDAAHRGGMTDRDVVAVCGWRVIVSSRNGVDWQPVAELPEHAGRAICQTIDSDPNTVRTTEVDGVQYRWTSPGVVRSGIRL